MRTFVAGVLFALTALLNSGCHSIGYSSLSAHSEGLGTSTAAPGIYWTDLVSAEAKRNDDGSYAVTCRWNFPVQGALVSQPVADQNMLDGVWYTSGALRSWESVEDDYRTFSTTVHPSSRGWFIKLMWLHNNGMMQPYQVLYFNGERFMPASGGAGSFEFDEVNGVAASTSLPEPELHPDFEFFLYRDDVPKSEMTDDGQTMNYHVGSRRLFESLEGDLFLFLRSWVPLGESRLWMMPLRSYEAGLSGYDFAWTQVELGRYDSRLYRDFIHYAYGFDADFMRLVNNGMVMRLEVHARDEEKSVTMDFYVCLEKGIVRLKDARSARDLIEETAKPEWTLESYFRR